MITLVEFFVPGTPRPKGSLRHVGKGRMVEQVASSGDWRAAVAYHARQALAEALSEAGDQPGAYTGPVAVYLDLQFEAPKSAHPDALPGSRRTGDIDKHERNIYDALVDAGVIKDDSQIVNSHSSKRYTRVERPGAYIRVKTVAW